MPGHRDRLVNRRLTLSISSPKPALRVFRALSGEKPRAQQEAALGPAYPAETLFGPDVSFEPFMVCRLRSAGLRPAALTDTTSRGKSAPRERRAPALQHWTDTHQPRKECAAGAQGSALQSRCWIAAGLPKSAGRSPALLVALHADSSGPLVLEGPAIAPVIEFRDAGRSYRQGAREVAALTGLTARQLQVWDAGGLLIPTMRPRRTAAGGYTERRYTPIELFELLVLADLRRRGFSVHQLHQLVLILKEEFGERLFDATGGGGSVQLLTDGREIYARGTNGGFFNLLKAPRQPLLWAPPRTTRLSLASSYLVVHHCHMLPCMSHRPRLFGG